MLLEAWLTWLVPIISGFVAFFSARFSRRISHGISIASALTSLICSLILAYDIWIGRIGLSYEEKIPLLKGPEFEVSLGVLVDQLSLVMLIAVAFVSSVIFIYSVGYMEGEPDIGRYWFWMDFFLGSMQLLVISGNLVQMLMGWEMVGLCSWALISFWYKSKAPSPEPGFATEGEYNAHCGLKALITTSIADSFFIVAIFLIGWSTWMAYGRPTFDFLKLSSDFKWLGEIVRTGLVPFLAFALLSGPLGKSAQFPYNEWLPEAMAGPTTVSALIHAATMVKAGCYFVARFFITLIGAYPTYPEIKLFFWGALTMGAFSAFLAASQGMVAKELKKVLAYSTISQIGYIFSALGLAGIVLSREAFASGILHIISHALLKALLFLGAGAVIHITGTRYMYEMGGLRKYMPVTFWTMLIGALSLTGLPPFSGFFSKDEIIRSLYRTSQGLIGAAILIITVALTSFYTFRMIGLVFFGEPSDFLKGKKLKEAPKVMTGPLITLAIATSLAWLSYPSLSNFLVYGNFPKLSAPLIISYLRDAFVNPLSLLSLALILIGFYPAYEVYIAREVKPEEVTVGKLYGFLTARWYWNGLYYWLTERTRKFCDRIRYFQTGISNVNVAYMLTGFVIFLVLLTLLR